jgi:hypothetical protein
LKINDEPLAIDYERKNSIMSICQLLVNGCQLGMIG